MKWWKDPAWIGVISGAILIVLTSVIIAQGPRLNWFTWQGFVTIAIGLLVLGALVYATIINIKILRMKQPASLLTNKAREIARIRLDELSGHGQWLEGEVPRYGLAGEMNFCQFWAQDTQGWSNAVERSLRNNWGNAVADEFISNIGFNSQEPVGTVHQNAADAFRTLLHRQRNLQRVRGRL